MHHSCVVEATGPYAVNGGSRHALAGVPRHEHAPRVIGPGVHNYSRADKLFETRNMLCGKPSQTKGVADLPGEQHPPGSHLFGDMFKFEVGHCADLSYFPAIGACAAAGAKHLSVAVRSTRLSSGCCR